MENIHELGDGDLNAVVGGEDGPGGTFFGTGIGSSDSFGGGSDGSPVPRTPMVPTDS